MKIESNLVTPSVMATNSDAFGNTATSHFSQSSLMPMQNVGYASRIYDCLMFIPRAVWSGCKAVIRFASCGYLFALPKVQTIGDRFYLLADAISKNQKIDTSKLWPKIEQAGKAAYLEDAKAHSGKSADKWSKDDQQKASDAWDKKFKEGDISIFIPLKEEIRLEFNKEKKTALLEVKATWKKDDVVPALKTNFWNKTCELYPYLYKEAEQEYKNAQAALDTVDKDNRQQYEVWKQNNKQRVCAEFKSRIEKCDAEAIEPLIDALAQ